MRRACLSAATDNICASAAGGNPGSAIAIFEGDFCYSLPSGLGNPASQNQEEIKVKTNGNTVSPAKGKSVAARIRPMLKAVSSSDDCPREQMIAEAAYFRAQQRGFEPGNEMSDWLEAESDIERVLGDRQ